MGLKIKTPRKMRWILLVVLPLFLNSTASADQAWSTTVDGRLFVKGTTTPVTDDLVFKIQVLNPTKTCLLYEETQNYSTKLTQGYYNLKVGTNTPDATSKRTASDPGYSMAKIFNNNLNSFAVNGTCAGGYVPLTGHTRYMRIIVQKSTGPAEALSPDIEITSAPSAQVAETLQGYKANNFLQVNATAPELLDQATLESIFTTTRVPILEALLDGTSGLYMKQSSNGAASVPGLPATPSGATTGQMWYDTTTNQLKYQSNSGVATVGVSGSGVQSVTGGTGLTGGTITNTGTLAVDVGTTAGKIVQLDGFAKLPAVDGSALTNLNGSAVNSGTIGGTTAVNTSGNITTSGNIAANQGSFNAISSSQVSIYESDQSAGDINYINIKTPLTAALTTSYDLILPTTQGAAGQVMKNTGGGQLTWVNFGIDDLKTEAGLQQTVRPIKH